jgi:hypothetical protein
LLFIGWLNWQPNPTATDLHWLSWPDWTPKLDSV